MMVTCPKCKDRFDDARCWTICPHNSLDVAHDEPYCRRHDFYNCSLCPVELPKRMKRSDWNNQFFRQCKPIEPHSTRSPGFLMVYQQFKGVVEYKGRKYMVTAWCPPKGENYVTAELYVGD
jgi:hypothetical protein